MQLGSRWRAREAPHRSVPAALHDEIARQEALFPDAHSWTLTWLEGLPQCSLDGELVVSLTHSGEVRVRNLGENITDLAGAEVGDVTGARGVTQNFDAEDSDDDDDDGWLT